MLAAAVGIPLWETELLNPATYWSVQHISRPPRQLHLMLLVAAPLRSRRAWVRGKGGMIVGDLPPYEAFPIGGTNSVRGYSEGAPASHTRLAPATSHAWVQGVLRCQHAPRQLMACHAS